MTTLATHTAPYVSLDRITEVVRDFYGVTKKELLGRKRLAGVVRPRQVAMYLARKFTLRSLEEIGLHYGGRDHTTVMWGVERVTERAGADPAFAGQMQALGDRLTAGGSR